MKKSQKNFQVINSELSISWVEICENRQKFLEKKFRKYLVSSEKSRNFASQSRETRELPAKRLQNAKIAQLVEHNLAKVGVAGSSPVFRSKSERIREYNEIDKRWRETEILKY